MHVYGDGGGGDDVDNNQGESFMNPKGTIFSISLPMLTVLSTLLSPPHYTSE